MHTILSGHNNLVSKPSSVVIELHRLNILLILTEQLLELLLITSEGFHHHF